MPATADSAVKIEVKLLDLKAPFAAGAKLGVLTATVAGQSESVDLVAADGLSGPGAWLAAHALASDQHALARLTPCADERQCLAGKAEPRFT